MASFIKACDIFPKAAEGATRRTSEGGVVSLLALVIGFFLILGEVSRILEKPLTEKLILGNEDLHELDNIKLDFEIVFFALDCQRIKFELFSNVNTKQQNARNNNRDVTDLVQITGEDQGCVTKAVLDCPKHAGNLHVTLIPHTLAPGIPITGITITDFTQYNASHEIRKLRFFSESDDPTKGKLDGTRNVNHQYTAYFLYDVHLVPVMTNISGTSLSHSRQLVKRFPYNYRSRQFEVGENEVMPALSMYGMPGLYIGFDFSPLILEKNPGEHDYLQFFIRLIGIVGGLTMLVSLFDTAIHLGIAPLKRKLD